MQDSGDELLLKPRNLGDKILAELCLTICHRGYKYGIGNFARHYRENLSLNKFSARSSRLPAFTACPISRKFQTNFCFYRSQKNQKSYRR